MPFLLLFKWKSERARVASSGTQTVSTITSLTGPVVARVTRSASGLGWPCQSSTKTDHPPEMATVKLSPRVHVSPALVMLMRGGLSRKAAWTRSFL